MAAAALPWPLLFLHPPLICLGRHLGLAGTIAVLFGDRLFLAVTQIVVDSLP